MSLILDALRKSEAERRRGQSPSLYAATPVPGTRARPAWLRWLPLVALAVLVVVALFTLLGNPGVATKDELEAESDVSVAESADITEPEATTTDPQAATAAATPAPSQRAASATPAPTVDALVKPATAAPTTTAPAPTPTIAAAPALPAQAESAPAADPTPLEQLPPVAVLDAGTRSGLPAMKLSMHVYNADATRRFAIIDGQRVTEGSQVGAATVVEIRRDGVVLDVSGRRVLLPRP
jgi:general secretion pathway protein B